MAASEPAPNYRLARTMAGAGFASHKAFARAVRKISEESGRPVGCDHTSVSRWLRGMNSPRGDTAAFIATALSRALGRPVSLADIGLSSAVTVPPDLGLDYLPSPDKAIDVIGRLLHADLDEATTIVTSPPDPGAWRSLPLDWLVGGATVQTQPQSGRQRVGSSDVTRARATIEVFAQLDNRFGGGHARHALIRYLADDLEPLLRGQYTDSVASELFSTAAEATRLAAWMSYDSGAHGLAQRYFVQAVGLAEAAGDRLLAGSILDAMSHQATFLGLFREAANLARAARLGTQHIATPTFTAHFHAMEARAVARLGDTRGCELALADAVRAFEHRNPENDPEWFRYFDDAELAAELGHCFRDLGQAEAAARYATQSIGSTCGTRSDFFATMVLAEAHLQAGEAEQACTVALQALQLGEELKSARCASYLREFRSELTAAGSSAAVRDFGEVAGASALWRQATAQAASG